MKKASDEVSVVICDDDRFVVESISSQLNAAGYAVAGTASNGLDLIRVCEECRPDIVKSIIRVILDDPDLEIEDIHPQKRRTRK